MKDQLAKMTIIELVRTAHSYSTSIKQTGVYSELVREMASRLEALNLAHIGAMAALETTAKRIAELEARTLTVKLPTRCSCCYSSAEAELFDRVVDEAREKFELGCAVAGIKLQIEGE